jgi:predicted DsbA family dithiol-disulfide isomerase
VSRASALVVLRIATLIAVAASAALAVEYRSGDFAFCGAESGCAFLRRTGFAYLWGAGITLPEVGLAGLSVVFALSLTQAVKWAARLAIAGALVALGLLAVQAFVVQRFCWLCATTDVCALLAGVAALPLLGERGDASRRDPLAPWAWGALCALAVAAPALWPELRPVPPVPGSIRAYYKPGKVNVVEFADFQCPFCRNLHQRLKPLLAPYGDRVNFVRLNMPLESHEHARDAALAALCAEPSGKADALADFLFTTEDLSVAAIGRAAAELGLEPAAFERCLAAPATSERLAREMKAVHEAGLQGLPTTYVGGRRLIGAQSDDTFRAALERAARGEDETGVPGWAYLLVVLASLLAIVRLGYRPTADTGAESDAARAV